MRPKICGLWSCKAYKNNIWSEWSVVIWGLQHLVCGGLWFSSRPPPNTNYRVNGDILRPTLYPGNLFFNTMALAGSRPVSSAPTRVTHTTATCINIIAVNEDLAVTQSNVIHIEPPATIIRLQLPLFLLNRRSLHLLSNVLLIKWTFLN